MSVYPQEQNFKIKSGATWRTPFQWKTDGVPVDMTNWIAKMQIRKAVGTTVLATPVFSEIDLTLGQFYLALSGAATNAMKKGVYSYDVFVSRTDQGVDPADIESIPLLEGTFEVVDNITEPPTGA